MMKPDSKAFQPHSLHSDTKCILRAKFVQLSHSTQNKKLKNFKISIYLSFLF